MKKSERIAALEADLDVLALRVDALAARVDALENPPAPVQSQPFGEVVPGVSVTVRPPSFSVVTEQEVDG